MSRTPDRPPRAGGVGDLAAALGAIRKALDAAVQPSQTPHQAPASDDGADRDTIAAAFEDLRACRQALAAITVRMERALAESQSSAEPQPPAGSRLGALTARQREILQLIVDGRSNKLIASDLGLSQRTVEAHRAAIMRRTGARSISALVRIALGGLADGGSLC